LLCTCTFTQKNLSGTHQNRNHIALDTLTAMTFINNILTGLSPLFRLAPYHLLSYGTLLGTTLYQTFVVTKVCYQALPMSAFTTLQKRIFPLYFQIHTTLLILTALTLPPYGPVSLIQKKKDWMPLAFATTMAMFNLVKWGPRTQTAMIDRTHQGARTAMRLLLSNMLTRI
jgi:hypothetical protein